MYKVQISGTGLYTPKEKISNDELVQSFNRYVDEFNETNSELSKKIIDNFEEEIKNFIQVCPKEMINKLDHSLTLNPKIKEVS